MNDDEGQRYKVPPPSPGARGRFHDNNFAECDAAVRRIQEHQCFRDYPLLLGASVTKRDSNPGHTRVIVLLEPLSHQSTGGLVVPTIRNVDTVLAIPRRTSDGKTLVVQLASFFRKSASLYVELLVELASGQVDQACAAEHNIEDYHSEKKYLKDQKLLNDRLMSYNSDGEEIKQVSINTCDQIFERISFS